MVKAIVTGGCGFIGSHLVELLLLNGHHVIIIDNLYSGTTNNISSVSSHPNLIFYDADILDKNKIINYFNGVDWIFHLAGLADIIPSIENPDVYFNNNVLGTLNVLQCARVHGLKRFVYAASSSCYGIPDLFPTNENSEIKPLYPYALTKHMGEELVMHWAKVFKLPALSLRLFNVYGQRSRTSGSYGAVFGVFLAQKLHGKPFTVVGDGEQTRDFIYVSDVASAFLKAAQSDISGEAFNVGSGNHYSINYLVELIGGNKIHIPKRPGEPDCTFADITKIKRAFNWTPIVNFDHGVKKIINVIDAWKDAPLWDNSSIDFATKSWFNYLGEK